MESIEARVRPSYYARLIVIGVLTAGLGFLVMGLEYLRWVRHLDADGVTRRDGKRLLWGDLQSMRFVRARLPSGELGALNHVQLVFAGGKAKVFPFVLANAGEVLRSLKAYPGGAELATFGF
jgi:hypothetical protein